MSQRLGSFIGQQQKRVFCHHFASWRITIYSSSKLRRGRKGQISFGYLTFVKNNNYLTELTTRRNQYFLSPICDICLEYQLYRCGGTGSGETFLSWPYRWIPWLDSSKDWKNRLVRTFSAPRKILILMKKETKSFGVYVIIRLEEYCSWSEISDVAGNRNLIVSDD